MIICFKIIEDTLFQILQTHSNVSSTLTRSGGYLSRNYLNQTLFIN